MSAAAAAAAATVGDIEVQLVIRLVRSKRNGKTKLAVSNIIKSIDTSVIDGCRTRV